MPEAKKWGRPPIRNGAPAYNDRDVPVIAAPRSAVRMHPHAIEGKGVG